MVAEISYPVNEYAESRDGARNSYTRSTDVYHAVYGVALMPIIARSTS